METYPKFKYDSPSTTLDNCFNTIDFNQNETSPSGKAQVVWSSPLVELWGGNTTKEAMDEYIVIQFEKQALIEISV